MPNLSDLFSAGGFLKWDGAGNADADYSSQTPAQLAADAAFTGAFVPQAAASKYLFATRFASANGAPTLRSASAASSREAWLLDASTLEAVTGSFDWQDLPAWDAYNVYVAWSNNGAGAGDVVWRFDYTSTPVGVGDLVTGGFTVGANTTDTAGAQNEIMEIQVASAIAVNDTWPVGLKVLRIASDAADTLANDAAFLWVRLGKA